MEVSKASPQQADLVEVNEVAARLIREQAGDLIVGLSETRREVVRRTLSAGLRQGLSDAVIQARLAQVVGLDVRGAQAVQAYRQGQIQAGVKPSRAERQTKSYAKRLLNQRLSLISQNEIRTGLMLAQRAVWQRMQEDGDFSQYAVRVTRVQKDERLCSVCGPEHGRRRSLKRDLDLGPPFHPRCRCQEEVVDEGVSKDMPGSGDLYIQGPLQHMATGYVPKKKRRKKKTDPEMMTPVMKNAPGVVDGDGDGFVYDSTPKMRPATPAERAAGAALRARAAAPAAAKAPAAKKTPPKTDYDRRVDKFDRAVTQAIRSKDPKKIKEIAQYIRADLVLKKPDKDDLANMLAARRDGLPDPAPVKGGNREKRGGKGAAPMEAPAKAAKAPAKKAPAKAPAKKPAPKEEKKAPAAPPVPKRDDAADRRAAGLPSNAQREEVRVANRDRLIAEAANANSNDLAVLKVRADRMKAAGGLAGPEHGKVMAALQDRDDAIKRAVAAKKATPPAKKSAPASVSPAVKAHRERIDLMLGGATSASTIDRIKAAYEGRIGRDESLKPDERQRLLAGLERAAEARKRVVAQGGPGVGRSRVRQNSVVARALQNARERFRATARPGPQTQNRRGAEHAAKQIKRQMDEAKSLTALEAVKQGIHVNDRRVIGAQQDLLEGLNAHYKSKKDALRAAAPPMKRATPVSRRAAPPPAKKAAPPRPKPQSIKTGPETKAYEDIQNATKAADLDRIANDIDRAYGEGKISRERLNDVLAEVQRERKNLGGSTVKPPSQPNVARAAAKKVGAPKPNPVARAWLNRVDAAKDRDALQEIGESIAEKADGMNETEVERLFEAIDKKYRKMVPLTQDDRFDRLANEPERNRAIPKWRGDVNDSPAGKMLDAGGKIEDVTDPAGMWDYITANGDRNGADHNADKRFRVTRVPGGQEKAHTVTDRQNGNKKYFFKETDNDGKVQMFGDGVNEYMAAALGNAAFQGMFPTVDWAGRPENNVNAHIRMEHLDEMKNRFGGDRVFYDGRRVDPTGLKDPRQALVIHMFDYLINQNDRHMENFGMIDTPGGQVLVPIDNGGAFHGYDLYVSNPVAAREFGVPQHIADALATAPESVSYEDWNRALKPGIMRHIAKKGYLAKGWSRDKINRDAEAIMKEFGSVDIDKIIADLRRRFPNMSAYESDHLDGVALIWKSRMDKMTPEQIVRMVSGP